MDILFVVGAGVLGILLGAGGYTLIERQRVNNAKESAEDILKQADRTAAKLEKEAYLRAKERFQKDRVQMEKKLKHREKDISRNENKIRQREKELRRLESSVKERGNTVNKQQQKLDEYRQRIAKEEEKVAEVIDQQIQRLEEISGLNRDEAKEALHKSLMNRVKSEAQQTILDIKKDASDRARWEAREIMAFAIEKMATEYTMESTLVSVSLPNDSWKGLIIGREGRNIKSFESTTGVKVIVDDTPETVVMSCFDPIKREVARLTMEALIAKKNINPKAIEHESAKAQKVVDASIRKASEETLRELKLRNVHPEMRNLLGRLKYRSSYGQNILQHSKEVAWLAGNMAAELGLDVMLARRAGLFHDIGKAVSNDSEGSHVTLGVEITERCKEHAVVINSVLAHHEEAEPISPISVLVTAADRISGARPGARRESLEAYAQRISKLEELANSFEGVAKTYALSAGREIRVMIQPEKLTDGESDMLASDIARKIKDTMEYPGQIKVTVIRHLVAQSSTDEALVQR